jgi:hypothetical protein
MIKVYASIASVGFLVLAGGAGCSSASTPDDGDGGTSSNTTNNTSGTATNTTAGTSTQSQGGSGNSSAGTGSDAGTGTTPTAGSSSGGAPAVGAMCKSIKTGMACAPEGTDCPTLACGLADSGTRACMCQGTWMCSSCDFSASPFKDKPADAEPCTTQADKLECTTKGAVCTDAPGGEVCACWPDDEGALIWDCDKPPTSWAAAAM